MDLEASRAKLTFHVLANVLILRWSWNPGKRPHLRAAVDAVKAVFNGFDLRHWSAI